MDSTAALQHYADARGEVCLPDTKTHTPKRLRIIEAEEVKLDREIDVSLCMELIKETRRSLESQVRRRGSRRDLARVTELMSRIENGQQVRQECLDYFGIILCPALSPPGRSTRARNSSRFHRSCAGWPAREPWWRTCTWRRRSPATRPG